MGGWVGRTGLLKVPRRKEPTTSTWVGGWKGREEEEEEEEEEGGSSDHWACGV